MLGSFPLSDFEFVLYFDDEFSGVFFRSFMSFLKMLS